MSPCIIFWQCYLPLTSAFHCLPCPHDQHSLAQLVLSNPWCLHHSSVLHPHLRGSGIRCSGSHGLWPLYGYLVSFALRYHSHSWTHRQDWSSSLAVKCADCASGAFPHQKVTFLPLQHPPHAYCLHQDAMRLAYADTHVNIIYGLLAVIFIIVLDALILLASYFLIFQAVLGIASWEERLKALNTYLSHICALLLFYGPLIGMTVSHCFGKHLSPVVHMVMAGTYLPLPSVLSLIVYSVRTKQIRQWIVQVFPGDRVGS